MVSEGDDRLERIEKMLRDILLRLERLESIISSIEDAETAQLAARLAFVFSLPAYQAVRIASSLSSVLRRAPSGSLDDLDIMIIEVLAVEGELSLRGLERAIRESRGRASRTTLVKRIRKLERLGIVRVEHQGNKMKIRLVRRDDV
ncbi:MAG: hypothetical protein GSR77_05670 [Desulfurococcales archaeon]|nr:hypothetical protein [Desulfurococcales archaeon]